MPEEKKKRALFASRFGAIAASVGSAVGLGNIWRFPYEAGIHGGGAFLICYIAFVLLLGVPVLCAEFAMGRASRSNVFGAYRRLGGSAPWQVTGVICIVASFMIISFYSVVAGWTLEYSVSSIAGGLDFEDKATAQTQFAALTTGWNPLIWTLIFLVFNFAIMLGGVTKGIERVSNILMPVLFVLLLAFCIHSATMPGFVDGISFLFKPDFSAITPSVLLGAMGQAFFSLSIGLGCMMTYASYFNRDIRLTGTATTIAGLDFLVALLAGIIIFPAVFSYGMSPQAGPTLVFEVLPYIFMQLPGGAVWSTLFFLLLFVASITSTVSMSEISITYFCEERSMSRRSATLLSAAITVAGATLCALSFGAMNDCTIAGKTVFDIFDYVSSNILLPAGGMVCCIFVGWKMDRRPVEKELAGETPTGARRRVMRAIIFGLRYICPAAIFLIFLNSIGLI